MTRLQVEAHVTAAARARDPLRPLGWILICVVIGLPISFFIAGVAIAIGAGR